MATDTHLHMQFQHGLRTTRYSKMIKDLLQQWQTLPLIPAPAHEWSTLLTVLKQAKHINAAIVGPNQKTIITLDMDLYTRANKLQSIKPELTNNCVLKVGEFHTVICTLQAIGSSIETSGIDDAWIEAGIYSSTTTRQLLEGRHMKRAVTAHIITLQALHDLLLDEYQASEGPLPETLSKSMKCLKSAFNETDTAKAQEALNNIEQLISENKLDEFCIKHVATSLMFKVMKMYMNFVLTLLQFIKASQQGDWILHLISLEELCKHFFSQNRLKYAQHIPEYLSKMHSLQISDPDFLNYFCEGNFSVKKTKTSFL